jgi:hypothetical protein
VGEKVAEGDGHSPVSLPAARTFEYGSEFDGAWVWAGA